MHSLWCRLLKQPIDPLLILAESSVKRLQQKSNEQKTMMAESQMEKLNYIPLSKNFKEQV